MPGPVLYVWKSPRPADAEEAAALVRAWEDGDHNEAHRGPFEWSDDVVWFHREMTGDAPPVWNPDKPASDPDPPDTVIPVELREGSEDEVRDQLGEIFGLAMKYDLIVYDPQRGTVHAPLAEYSAAATAAFWPGGALRAAVVGIAGGVLAVVAWILGIPLVSGILVIVGAFLVVMTISVFVHDARGRRS